MKSHQEMEDRNKKSITPKAFIIKEKKKEEPSEEDEDLLLNVRKLKMFINFEENRDRMSYPRK